MFILPQAYSRPNKDLSPRLSYNLIAYILSFSIFLLFLYFVRRVVRRCLRCRRSLRFLWDRTSQSFICFRI